MSKLKEVQALIPEVFAPLMLEKKRIKFCYGGRAGGKSYAFADSLLFLGRMQKLFIVCLREVQGSIRDSVHKLLSDRISYYNLDDYVVKETRIENKITKTVFVFKGLRDQDPQKIKSLEGADIAWIEEAQTISKKSWDILEPTIRKPGSEIWISMNRENVNDPLWQALSVFPSENVWVQKVNYYDNPFCPKEMKELAERCLKFAPEDYAHIWLGEPVERGDMRLIFPIHVQKAQVEKTIATQAPLVIGLDIARFGNDKTVFCFRRGRVCERFIEFSKKSVVEVAEIAAGFIMEYLPKRLFLDIGGVGGGVYDLLKEKGFSQILRGVNFGEKALNSTRFTNRRAEMWFGVAHWLSVPDQVLLPLSENLFLDLTSVHKKYDKLGRLQLESKEEIKRRLGRSTDLGDALALTFAESEECLMQLSDETSNFWLSGKPCGADTDGDDAHFVIEKMFQPLNPLKGW